jgi:UDP-N-acetylmuramyl pentapeptide synthase
LVGKEFAKIKHPFHQFSNAEEAGLWLKNYAPKHKAILVKGSRSSTMEKTIEGIVHNA